MTQTVIDPGMFETLKAMTGADYLPVLIDAYYEDADGLFEEMRAALAAGDSARFGRAAHSLKGNSANFGATHLTDLSRELEFLGKGGSLEGAGPKLEDLAAEYARVKQALEALRDDL
jgi:HPt (histidine-containing phosphotransfer) domain-containing protein